MSERHEWKLILRAPSTDDEAAAVRRLRAALKALLRSYGLRCVAVAPNKPSEATPPE